MAGNLLPPWTASGWNPVHSGEAPPAVDDFGVESRPQRGSPARRGRFHRAKIPLRGRVLWGIPSTERIAIVHGEQPRSL